MLYSDALEIVRDILDEPQTEVDKWSHEELGAFLGEPVLSKEASEEVEAQHLAEMERAQASKDAERIKLLESFKIDLIDDLSRGCVGGYTAEEMTEATLHLAEIGF